MDEPSEHRRAALHLHRAARTLVSSRVGSSRRPVYTCGQGAKAVLVIPEDQAQLTELREGVVEALKNLVEAGYLEMVVFLFVLLA